MKKFFITMLVLANQAWAHELTIPVGVTRFKVEHDEPISLTKARFVVDESQKLTLSCPEGKQILESSCEGASRTLNKFAISGDLSRPVFVETSVKDNAFSCVSTIVRPEEFIKLTASVKCGNANAVSYRSGS